MVKKELPKAEEYTQLAFAVRVSTFEQIKISTLRWLRELNYSLGFLFFRNIILWVNIGITIFLFVLYGKLLFGVFPIGTKVMIFPGLFSRGLYDISFISLEDMKWFLFGFLGIFSLFTLSALFVLRQNKGLVSNVFLGILFLLQIIIVKILIENLSIWGV